MRAERAFRYGHPDSWLLVPGSWFLEGGVAQLGERLLCKQEVDGSSPFTSTSLAQPDWCGRQAERSSAESPVSGAPLESAAAVKEIAPEHPFAGIRAGC